jgi:hypothetical protein
VVTVVYAPTPPPGFVPPPPGKKAEESEDTDETPDLSKVNAMGAFSSVKEIIDEKEGMMWKKNHQVIVHIVICLFFCVDNLL